MSAKPVIYKNRKKCHVKIKKYKKSNLNYFFLINKFFGRLFMSFRNDYIHSFIADRSRLHRCRRVRMRPGKFWAPWRRPSEKSPQTSGFPIRSFPRKMKTTISAPSWAMRTARAKTSNCARTFSSNWHMPPPLSRPSKDRSGRSSARRRIANQRYSRSPAFPWTRPLQRNSWPWPVGQQVIWKDGKQTLMTASWSGTSTTCIASYPISICLASRHLPDRSWSVTQSSLRGGSLRMPQTRRQAPNRR